MTEKNKEFLLIGYTTEEGNALYHRSQATNRTSTIIQHYFTGSSKVCGKLNNEDEIKSCRDAMSEAFYLSSITFKKGLLGQTTVSITKYILGYENRYKHKQTEHKEVQLNKNRSWYTKGGINSLGTILATLTVIGGLLILAHAIYKRVQYAGRIKAKMIELQPKINEAKEFSSKETNLEVLQNSKKLKFESNQGDELILKQNRPDTNEDVFDENEQIKIPNTTSKNKIN